MVQKHGMVEEYLRNLKNKMSKKMRDDWEKRSVAGSDGTDTYGMIV